MSLVSKSDLMPLIRDLCEFRTGVVAKGNTELFARISKELPIKLYRYKSGETFNGWVVPDDWCVERALIRKNGKVVFDGLSNSLGVAYYSKSFSGTLTWEQLEPHLVTNPKLPAAYMFHCIWQYRPWAADWAFSVPYRIYRNLGPGSYEIELHTVYTSGDMLLAEHEHKGRSNKTIVFHSNNCHPHMANDGFAGTAVMIRLFQWLARKDTYYTYRLVIGPEHIGTIFYLRDMPVEELSCLVGGVFGEMMGTKGPFKVASTFSIEHMLDQAFHNVVSHYAQEPEFVPWRMSVGNDETVWEAPGYEVPFIQVNRARDRSLPFPEYHSSQDSPDLMDIDLLEEFIEVFKKVVFVLENNSTIQRKFNGLLCLSSPEYDLYKERPDPAMKKHLPQDSEKWGYLQDCLLRYFDGSLSILDIAERHDLPFDLLFRYIKAFQEKGLVALERSAVTRTRASLHS